MSTNNPCDSHAFQTPEKVADYMAYLLPENWCLKQIRCLEPTAGQGNLVKAVKKRYKNITEPLFSTPKDFWKMRIPPPPPCWDTPFHCAIMNPPFTPMKEGFRYLYSVMGMTTYLVALLPWLAIINSERRIKEILGYGLISITHLPRKTFPGSRIQCCVVQMQKGYTESPVFKHFEF